MNGNTVWTNGDDTLNFHAILILPIYVIKWQNASAHLSFMTHTHTHISSMWQEQTQMHSHCYLSSNGKIDCAWNNTRVYMCFEVGARDDDVRLLLLAPFSAGKMGIYISVRDWTWARHHAECNGWGSCLTANTRTRSHVMGASFSSRPWPASHVCVCVGIEKSTFYMQVDRIECIRVLTQIFI